MRAGGERRAKPSFFPTLIAHPFRSGLHEAFAFAICACLVAALASWSRGSRYIDSEAATTLPMPEGTEPSAQSI